MSRPILSEYGPDTPKPMAPRASSGGVTQAKTLPYSPPQGPIGIMHKGVGLGGHNCGNCGTQGPYDSSGDGASGSPGLHGDNRGHGTNRS